MRAALLSGALAQRLARPRAVHIQLRSPVRLSPVCLSACSSSVTAATLLEQRPGMAVGASAVAGLQPAALWKFFAELTQIPRPSKHEERCALPTGIPFLHLAALLRSCALHTQAAGWHLRSRACCRVLQWVKDFAEQRGLKWRQDDVGNLVVLRPGSGGGEAAPPVVIQVLGALPSAAAAARGPRRTWRRTWCTWGPCGNCGTARPAGAPGHGHGEEQRRAARLLHGRAYAAAQPGRRLADGAAPASEIAGPRKRGTCRTGNTPSV